MPVGVLKDRVAACHVCVRKDVPVTSVGNLMRHKNTRGHVCKGSASAKQSRTQVKR